MRTKISPVSASCSMPDTWCACDMLLPSFPILCNPTDCSPPGFSIYGDSPGKNTGVVCHALLQRIFLTQGSNRVSYISWLGRWVLYHWCHLRSPDTWQVHKTYLFNKCLNRGRENMTSIWDCKIFEERRLWRFFGVFCFFEIFILERLSMWKTKWNVIKPWAGRVTCRLL